MEQENLKENSNWGGARDGAGRKEGSENQATKEKRIAEKEIKDRIIKSKDALLNAQMSIAKGVQMLFKIETSIDGEGKKRKSKPILVTSQHEIEDYLAGNLEEEDYYFITTERPENKAIDSLFNRVLGTPKQSMDLSVSQTDESWDNDRIQMQEIIKQIENGKIQTNSETVGKAILQKQQ